MLFFTLYHSAHHLNLIASRVSHVTGLEELEKGTR
jgi:hypothetical protein